MTAHALFGNGSRFRDKSKLIVHIAPKVLGGGGGFFPHSHNPYQLPSITGGNSALSLEKDHLCHIIPALITALSPDLRLCRQLHVLITGKSSTLDSKACTKFPDTQ